MSIFDRYEFLVPEHGRRDLGLLRWALVIVFLWFGAMKFTAYEAYGIAPFIEHSPIMSGTFSCCTVVLARSSGKPLRFA